MTHFDDQEQARQSIEHIADRAAAKAVRDTLMLIGIDVTNPIKAQEEFATLRRMVTLVGSERTQQNLVWLETLHSASEKVADTGWRTVTRLLITAGIGLLAVMTREYWFTHVWK